MNKLEVFILNLALEVNFFGIVSLVSILVRGSVITSSRLGSSSLRSTLGLAKSRNGFVNVVAAFSSSSKL